MKTIGDWKSALGVVLAALASSQSARAEQIDSVISEASESGSGLSFQPVISVDEAGNRYVAGSFDGVVIFGEGADARTLEGTQSDVYVAKYAPSGALQWVRELESAPGASSATAQGIAVDYTGGVYVAGHFTNRVTIGSTTLVGGSNANGYLTRLNAGTGQVEWVNQIASLTTNVLRDLDADGNVAITGRFRGTTEFRGQFGSKETLTTFTPLGDDMYVAFYDQAGQVIFASHAGGDGADGLGVHTNVNSINVVGSFHGPLLIQDQDDDPIEFTAQGGEDGFWVRYNTRGRVRAAEQFAGPDTSSGLDAAASRLANVYVIGQFSNSVTVGTTTLTSRGETDSYIARMDVLSGRVDGVLQVGGPGRDVVRGLDVDAAQNVHLAGTFSGSTLTIGRGGAAIELARQPSGRQTAFVGSVQGNFALTPIAGQVVHGDFEPNRVAVDTSGNVNVAGSHRRELGFGDDGADIIVPAPAQGTGLVVARFAPDS